MSSNSSHNDYHNAARESQTGGNTARLLNEGESDVPEIIMKNDPTSQHSPGSLRKSISDSNVAVIELEVPQTSNLNVSASSSIEDWTQTDDLGESWVRGVGFADSGTDPDNNDLLDELERLRRERQRILDMLAKDLMPSKLQVYLYIVV